MHDDDPRDPNSEREVWTVGTFGDINALLLLLEMNYLMNFLSRNCLV